MTTQRRTPDGFSIHSGTPMTDQEAMDYTFVWPVKDIDLSEGYVELYDPEGVRIGRIGTIVLNGNGTATISLDLM